MKLSEKIEKLDNTVRRLHSLHALCPDIEIVNSDNNDRDYYVSSQISHVGEDVEFLAPQSTYHAIHKACVYRDFTIEGIVYRIYGKPFPIKLFVVLAEEDGFQCYDYVEQLGKYNINPAALRKMHLYVIDFMRDSNISVNKNSLPNNIRNLLAFM